MAKAPRFPFIETLSDVPAKQLLTAAEKAFKKLIKNGVISREPQTEGEDVATKFNYAVGRPWDVNKPTEGIGFYTYHSEIHRGTIDEAIEHRDYCNSKIPETEDLTKRGTYRIYQVVEIPESATMKKQKNDTE